MSLLVNKPRIWLNIKLIGYYITKTENWKERLLENIDADQLPVTYGGTRCDENGDQRCALHVRNSIEYQSITYLGYF